MLGDKDSLKTDLLILLKTNECHMDYPIVAPTKQSRKAKAAGNMLLSQA